MNDDDPRSVNPTTSTPYTVETIAKSLPPGWIYQSAWRLNTKILRAQKGEGKAYVELARLRSGTVTLWASGPVAEVRQAQAVLLKEARRREWQIGPEVEL